MTQRLIALLHEEADLLEVPAAPTSGILADAHRRRRTAQARLAVGVGTVVLATVGVGAVVLPGDGDGTKVATVPSSPYLSEGALALDHAAFLAFPRTGRGRGAGPAGDLRAPRRR